MGTEFAGAALEGLLPAAKAESRFNLGILGIERYPRILQSATHVSGFTPVSLAGQGMRQAAPFSQAAPCSAPGAAPAQQHVQQHVQQHAQLHVQQRGLSYGLDWPRWGTQESVSYAPQLHGTMHSSSLLGGPVLHAPLPGTLMMPMLAPILRTQGLMPRMLPGHLRAPGYGDAMILNASANGT